MTWWNNLRDWFRLTLAAKASGLTPGVLASWVLQYGPLIMAIIQVIRKAQTEEAQQERLVDFERGFRVLVETDNPQLLEDTLKKHCRPDTGCMFP